MSGVKHTPGPLTVRVSERWPYDIETLNAGGDVVFSDRMPAHSTAMRSHDDLWAGVGFHASQRQKVVEINRRAVADATIRASAPDLLEALVGLVDRDLTYDGPCIVIPAKSHVDAISIVRRARNAIARARGEQDGGWK